MNVELPPNETLREILARGYVTDADGGRLPLYAGISPLHAATLYRVVMEHRPKLVVETGMCLGISTLSILTALRERGEGGRLISIDPFQSTHDRSIGLLNVRRAGLDALHEFIEKTSYSALPELLAAGRRIQFGYIDGNHRFDHALLDFFYLDKMMDVGGVIAFNDCGWRAIHHALNFVRMHRKYKELDVALRKSYEGRNVLFSLIRRLERRSSSDRYFQKIEDWEPEGHFFRRP